MLHINHKLNFYSLFLSVVFILIAVSQHALAKVDAATDIANNVLMKKVSGLQLSFIENQGQIKDKSVKFYANTFAGTVFVNDKGEIVYNLVKSEPSKQKKAPGSVSNKSLNSESKNQDNIKKAVALRESLKGAKHLSIKGINKSSAVVNYFKGAKENWRSNIPTWQEVSFGEVYEGIELTLRAYGKNIEKLFTVYPEGSVQDIKLKMEGAKGLTVNKDGELEIETELGVVKFTKPVGYQEIKGERNDISVAYIVESGSNTYSFSVANYDNTKPLIIDPLLASTFIGGSNREDEVYGIVLDSSGNVFIAGHTYSDDYRTTPGAYDTTGNYSIFISKFDNTLSNLLSSTFIGENASSSNYYKPKLGLDPAGNVFIAGESHLLPMNYPATPGAFDTSQDYGDFFISKFDNNLSTLLASTFLGGSSWETPGALYVDSAGNVYIAGVTGSEDFPTSNNAYRLGGNLFISKLDNNLSILIASTCLGYSNSNAFAFTDLALDSAGNVFVTGYMDAQGYYPVTPGAFDTTHNGFVDIFISKFDNSLSNLLASTFLGGSSTETLPSLNLDSAGNVFITGITYSSDYPTTAGAYDTSYYYNDVFVSKLDNNLSSLLASTFIGNINYDHSNAIAINSDGDVFITGSTDEYNKRPSYYPVTTGAFDTTFNGASDVFISKLDNNLSSILASTFLGGCGDDYADAIAISAAGNVFIAGITESSLIQYPTTPGAYDTSPNGSSDVFVSKLTPDLSAGPNSFDEPSLIGTLRNAITNIPLSGVTITVDVYYSAVTDSDGYYEIHGLSCGTHELSVNTPSGYSAYSRTIDTTEVATWNINLTKPETVYGSETPSGYSADPVNTATGNYIYEKGDIEIPGKGIPFIFERNYNSQDETDGPLGFGWNHSYNSELTVNADSTVTIRWGDGKTETWTPDGYGGYSPQYGVYDTLIDNGDGTFTLHKKDLTNYDFDTSGRLSSIIDKNGNTISFTYTGSNLTQISDTAGRNINFTYDVNNRIILITDPIGRTLQYVYDTNGNLISFTDMKGNTTAYTYDSQHQLLTVVDPRGNTLVSNTYDALKRVVTSQSDAKGGVTSYTYEELDKKTTIVNQLGYTTIHYHDPLLRLIQDTDDASKSAYYTYDSAGNRVKVTDKNGNETNYTYDSNGNVLTKTDALGNVTTITYDANNNPLIRTDAFSYTTTFEYDANGNLLKMTDALGNFTTITYDTNGQPLTITDARGNTTTNAYDTDGNLISVTDALSNISQFTYDGVGRRLTKVDALSRTTTYVYDDNDNVLYITDPLGVAKSFTYDGNNNRLTVTDPNVNTTTYTYDVKDLLETITDPLLNTVTNTYDALDRRISVTDKRGNTTIYTYDAVGNLLTITDPLGNVTTYTYDANGNKLTETNPLGQTTTYTYDALNRLVTETDNLGNVTTTAYDALGRVISTTNAKGQTTAFDYDALGRLIQVTDANGGIVTYTYDENGNRLTMTDPNGNTTSYTSDALNRLIQKVEPLGNTYQYAYDALGNRISLTDAKGITINYTYDANNRLSVITYPDTSTVTFSYNAIGNRTQMVDSLGTSTYSYDALNRMVSYTDPFGKTISYGYDQNGNRTSLTYPDSKVVNYTYDALNRLSNVTDWLTNTTSYVYDDVSKLITTTNPNGTTANYSYDIAGRLTVLSNKYSDTSVISSYTFTLDEIGNHTSAVKYEPLLPILTNKNITYIYDAENRLINEGGNTHFYDANGNLTAEGSDNFICDYKDRLIQSNISGVITQYSYDGLGNRLSKTEGIATTKYVLDINRKLANVIAETDNAGTITAYYVYGLGLISKVLPDGTAYYYHYDSRGSTIALSDAADNLTDTYAYGTFGNLANSQGTTVNHFKYVGRYGVMDEGNGLNYIRARYYSPEIGRFITKDPFAGNDSDGQSLNRYIYALNNTVSLIDISGLSPQEGGGNWGYYGSSDVDHDYFIGRSEYGGMERYLDLLSIGGKLGAAFVKSSYYSGIQRTMKSSTSISSYVNNSPISLLKAFGNITTVIGLYGNIGNELSNQGVSLGWTNLKELSSYFGEVNLDDVAHGTASATAIAWNTVVSPVNAVTSLAMGGESIFEATGDDIYNIAKDPIGTLEVVGNAWSNGWRNIKWAWGLEN